MLHSVVSLWVVPNNRLQSIRFNALKLSYHSHLHVLGVIFRYRQITG